MGTIKAWKSLARIVEHTNPTHSNQMMSRVKATGSVLVDDSYYREREQLPITTHIYWNASGLVP